MVYNDTITQVTDRNKVSLAACHDVVDSFDLTAELYS